MFNRVLMAITGAAMLACTSVRDIRYGMSGTSVDLSRRGLTEIPEEVFLNTEIKVLRLYGNQLDSIPERISQLVNLERLYLGKNNLTHLPNSIGKLKKLKILSAQYNTISQLPESLGELEQLEELILNQNELVALPNSIAKLKKLSVLELKFNRLTSLPDSIGACENLQFVALNRNFLSEVPESVGNLSRLKELYLSGAGPLLILPESLCRIRRLELLEIDRSTQVPQCLLVNQTTQLKLLVR